MDCRTCGVLSSYPFPAFVVSHFFTPLSCTIPAALFAAATKRKTVVPSLFRFFFHCRLHLLSSRQPSPLIHKATPAIRVVLFFLFPSVLCPPSPPLTTTSAKHRRTRRAASFQESRCNHQPVAPGHGPSAHRRLGRRPCILGMLVVQQTCELRRQRHGAVSLQAALFHAHSSSPRMRLPLLPLGLYFLFCVYSMLLTMVSKQTHPLTYTCAKANA